MTAPREDFQAIEIDALDDRLAETARRKRIPSMTRDSQSEPPNEAMAISEEMGADSLSVPSAAAPVEIREPAAAAPTARRRPLSLEVPDYLARELKVKAATEAVTVRYLVLSALADAGYRVDPDELEEDGRRLR